ncbi:nucleotidyltransferase domain-containing protein [bacterium]|nr:nucleotidyltransferase domain-containing protein [bacterium]
MQWILPVGTQVVTLIEIRAKNKDILFPAGAVGIIVKSPTDSSHAYRVRFPDGYEANLRRNQLALRKHYQSSTALGTSKSPEHQMYDYVIYRCVVGSRAYGLEQEESAIDRRGIYLPPAMLHWSLFGVPEQLESPETQETYWELQKFLILALKANPNVLECLYTPLVEYANELAQELLDMRSIFLSKLVYQTYNGYVLSQFRKLEQDLRNRGAIRWKHAMHLIRLLISGITVLKEGLVPTYVDQYRDQLLAIRRGEVSWEDINRWRLGLHKEFDSAYSETRLPDQPEYDRANVFLLKARGSMI